MDAVVDGGKWVSMRQRKVRGRKERCKMVKTELERRQRQEQACDTASG
jgi:hypothetical protein